MKLSCANDISSPTGVGLRHPASFTHSPALMSLSAVNPPLRCGCVSVLRLSLVNNTPLPGRSLWFFILPPEN